MRRRSSRFTAVRFDLPGSGRSHRVEGALSIDGFVEACLRVLASRNMERVHVLGHSLGTIVATHLAAREPRIVRSLALFGPLLAPPDVARTGIKARAGKARGEGVAGMQAIADTLVQGATSAETKARRPAVVAYVRELIMRQDPEGYARTCEALAVAEAADASAITCPTVLVTGDEDGVAPPHSVRALGDKIAGSQVEVLRGCGHWTPLGESRRMHRHPAPVLCRRGPGGWQARRREEASACPTRCSLMCASSTAAVRRPMPARCWSRAIASRA